ncbi:pyruvate oxidase, partial [Streptococcus sp. GMD4S]
KDKYEDTNKHLFGCDFPNADYAKIAEAQGAVGFTVDRIEDIDAVVAEAVKLNKEGKTVVIDARITPHRPLPVEVLELDPKLHSEEAIKDFKEKYEAEELVPFRLFLEEEGLQSRAIK